MEIKRKLCDGRELTIDLTPLEVAQAWKEQERLETEENVRQFLSDMIAGAATPDIREKYQVFMNDMQFVKECAARTRNYRDNNDTILDLDWACVCDAVKQIAREKGICINAHRASACEM